MRNEKVLVVAVEHAGWRDYLELCKPKVVAVMLLTAVVGMFVAMPGLPAWDAVVFGTIGIGLAAGSAAAASAHRDRRQRAASTTGRGRRSG